MPSDVLGDRSEACIANVTTLELLEPWRAGRLRHGVSAGS